jgi:hypothetical protein
MYGKYPYKSSQLYGNIPYSSFALTLTVFAFTLAQGQSGKVMRSGDSIGGAGKSPQDDQSIRAFWLEEVSSE